MSFTHAGKAAIEMVTRDSRAVWLVFIDLDGFKLINDSLGHKAGDLTLNVIAERLRPIVRDTDTVARLGGDEFVLLLPESASEIGAVDLVRCVSAAVARPLHVGGHEFVLSCSIGVAAFPDDGTDPDTLVERADTAMYRAKQAGRNNVQFYTATMNERALERLQLVSA